MAASPRLQLHQAFDHRRHEDARRDAVSDALSSGDQRVHLRGAHYLPTNLTRPQIASELNLSVHTVNTHIRNIYTKLGARDRSSAISRARELRLLSTGRS